MKKLILTAIAGLLLGYLSFSQPGEMEKYYSQYRVSIKQKKQCDSVYKLINLRRSGFSKDFRNYKEKNGDPAGFVYNWSNVEDTILTSLRQKTPVFLRHLLYYSYFDLGYGAYGLNLKPEICQQAIKEIPASSMIWAMEPSLLEAVIKFAGGEDKYKFFITNILRQNKDANLIEFVKNTLSPERPLKVGKHLPELLYRDLTDTTVLVSTSLLSGKYYLIDIWATWCKPCIDELPALNKIYLSRSDSLEFLSISIDNDVTGVLKFLETKTSILWVKGIAVSRKDLMTTMGISGIPCTILISPDRKILSYGNELRGSELEKTVKKWVK